MPGLLIQVLVISGVVAERGWQLSLKF